MEKIRHCIYGHAYLAGHFHWPKWPVKQPRRAPVLHRPLAGAAFVWQRGDGRSTIQFDDASLEGGGGSRLASAESARSISGKSRRIWSRMRRANASL